MNLRRVYELLRRRGPTAPAGSDEGQVDIYQVQRRLLGDRPVRWIIDAGSNRGDTIANYRNAFPEAAILGFEPTPQLLSELRARFADDPKIAIEPRAVADKPGTRELFLYANDATNSLLELTDRVYTEGEIRQLGRVSVDVSTLDDHLDECGIRDVDILKTDLQGGDLTALRGARRRLSEGRVRLLMLELLFVPLYAGQGYAWEVCSQLDTWGYRLFGVFDVRSSPDGQIKWGDGLFLPSAD